MFLIAFFTVTAAFTFAAILFLLIWNWASKAFSKRKRVETIHNFLPMKGGLNNAHSDVTGGGKPLSGATSDSFQVRFHGA